MGEEYRHEKHCPDKCRDGCCLWCRWDSCQGYWVCHSRPCHNKDKQYEGGGYEAPVREAVKEEAAPQQTRPRQKYQSRNQPVKEPQAAVEPKAEQADFGGNGWAFGEYQWRGKEPCDKKPPCHEKDPCEKKDPCCGKDPCHKKDPCGWWVVNPCFDQHVKKPQPSRDYWCCEEEHEKPERDKDFWHKDPCCEEEYEKPERDKGCWHEDPCCGTDHFFF